MGVPVALGVGDALRLGSPQGHHWLLSSGNNGFTVRSSLIPPGRPRRGWAGVRIADAAGEASPSFVRSSRMNWRTELAHQHARGEGMSCLCGSWVLAVQMRLIRTVLVIEPGAAM